MKNAKDTPEVKKRKSLRRRFILTEFEQQFYYQRPIFDDEERSNFFVLNDEARALIKNCFLVSAVYTILQLGYFKAKQQFFHVTFKEVQYEIEWIHYNHFAGKVISKRLPSRNIQSIIKNKIAKAMGYEINNFLIKKHIMEQAEFFARQFNNPAIIFKELFLCLKQKKLLLPGYTTVQDIISEASNKEEKRLFQIVDEHLKLNDSIKKQLDILLGSQDKLNRIRDLKLDLTGFNYSAMKQEINLYQSNEFLYQFAKNILPGFQISEQNMHYYANCTNYYSTYELNQLPKLTSYLYLLCYIYHRYQKMTDNLIQALIYQSDKVKKSAGTYASATYSQEQKRLLTNTNPRSIGLLIGNYANEPLLRSRKIFKEVAKEAYKIIPKKTIIQISQQMINQDTYQMELEWQYYHEHRQIMELNLRPIFRALNFQADKNNHSLLEAANFLKNIFNKGTPITKVPSSEFPQNVIPKKYKEIIIDSEGKIRPYHYEFLVYNKLRDYLVKNIIYLNDSIQYKSFDEDAKNNLENGDKEKLLAGRETSLLTSPHLERLCRNYNANLDISRTQLSCG